MLAVCTFLIYAKLLELNLVYGIRFFFVCFFMIKVVMWP